MPPVKRLHFTNIWFVYILFDNRFPHKNILNFICLTNHRNGLIGFKKKFKKNTKCISHIRCLRYLSFKFFSACCFLMFLFCKRREYIFAIVWMGRVKSSKRRNWSKSLYVYFSCVLKIAWIISIFSTVVL